MTVAVAIMLFVGAIAAGSALADGGTGSEEAVVPVQFTHQLVEEGIKSPTVDMGTPAPDSQAAEELPHEELGRNEALDLLNSVFGAQIEDPAGIFDELEGEKFLSDHAAVMSSGKLAKASAASGEEPESPPAEPTLVESTLPLRTENETGEKVPVDLSLEHSEGELEPAEPLVATEIPTELERGISLGNSDVTLEFPQAAGERAPTTVEEDAAFYPNVQTDSDLLIAPTPTGVETWTQLRSPEAPRTQRIHLDLPEGATLEESEVGGVEASLNGHVLLNVPPATATDAAGEEVPVSMSVDGANVEITVSPQADSSFPILVDPSWQFESWNWTWGTSSFSSWGAWSTTPSYQALNYGYPTTGTRALDITSGFPGAAAPWSWGEWVLVVPRFWTDKAEYGQRPQSFINSVRLEAAMFVLWGNSSYWPIEEAGILDEEKNEWVSVGNHAGTEGEVTGWSGQYTYPNWGDTNARIFTFRLITLEYESQAKYRTALAGAAFAGFGDHNTPELTLTAPSGWLDNVETSRIGYHATDPGLGVYEMRVLAPGSSAPTKYKVGCAGIPSNPCPRVYASEQPGSINLPINPASAPEGRDTYRVTTGDPLATEGDPSWDPNQGCNTLCNEPITHSVEGQAVVKIDHSAPTVALSGTLTEQATLGTSKPQYALKYSAADGTREPATIYTTFGAEGSGNGQFKHPADVALDPSENVWVADQANNRIEKLNVKGGFLAAYGSLGSGNGQLSGPSGIEADAKGNLWVADTGNNRIEELNSKGEYVTKFGTAGSGNGQLSSPKGIAVAPNGNLWVADTGNGRIEEFSSTGTFIGAFGTKGSGNLQFSEPSALDVGPGGNLWVADTGNNRIEDLTEKGEFLAAYGSLGSGNGQFNHPTGIDVDAKGNVYVLDENNGRVQQLSERGEYLGQFGAKGTGSGQFTFSGVAGLTTNEVGEIWVSDSGDNRIEEWNPPKGTRSGVRRVVVKMDGKEVQTPTVTCPQGGCPLAGEWTLQSGEYASGSHTVEVIATDGVELSKTEKQGITLNPPPPSLSLSGTLTEQGSLGTALPHYGLKLNASAEEGSGKGQAGSSTIATEITIDGKRADSGEASCTAETCLITREWTLNSGEYAAGPHAVLAKATDRFGRSTTKELNITLNPPAPSVTLSGTMTEQASLGTTRPRYVLRMNAAAEEGTGIAAAPAFGSSFGGSGSGNGQFAHPAGIAIDAAGSLWVADRDNNRVEEFNEKGEFVKAVGSAGSGPGQFTRPKSIAIDPKGDFWVADSGNSRLEEFSPSWEFIKVVGSSGSGNGQFSGPEGLAIDPKGNVWVADTYNYRVQELNEKGEFLKVISGLGAIEPTGLAVGPGGNVWIADWAHNRVVEVNEAGTLLRSFGSEGAGKGQFKQPDVVAVDGDGNVWVGDQNNERVQEFNQSGEYLAQFGAAGSGAGQFSFSYPMGIATDGKGNIWVSDTNNNRVQRWQLPSRSRVSTEIKIDGKQVDSGEATCPAETCPISREWVLDASSELIGKHTIVAKATDGYGQWTSKTRTIEIQPDTTKPTLQLSGELANAPEGWVQQESYGFHATATDAAGYGVTSLVFKIDGSTVASSTQPCPEGACESSLAKGINMAPYSGGAHEAEVAATDGAGNTTTRLWTINVDPEGHVTTAEATATLEAQEETGSANVVGESQGEPELEGSAAELGLESSAQGFEATGSVAPTTISAAPGGPMTIEIPAASSLRACGATPEEFAETEMEGSGEESPTEGECAEEEDEEDASALIPVEVVPVGVSGASGQPSLVEENAAVTSNTGGSVDTAVRPLADGGMIFESIRDDSAPEEYSYRVDLGEDQVLRSIDDQHAEVYYSGHEPAFSITAVPAHDAVGTAVPTSISVSGRDTVTLHVHFGEGHGGQPFVYPIVGGSGWEGGFRTIVVDMDNPPPEEEGGGSSESEEVAPGLLHLSSAFYGPPLASASSGGQTKHRRAYNFYQCTWRLKEGETGPLPSGPPGPIRRPKNLSSQASKCHGELEDTEGHQNVIDWAVSNSGLFWYYKEEHAWLDHADGAPNPHCQRWGEDKPELHHYCYADRDAVGYPGHIDIVGEYRFERYKYLRGWNTEECYEMEGSVSANPPSNQEDGERAIGDTHLHQYRESAPDPNTACLWGHLRHKIS